MSVKRVAKKLQKEGAPNVAKRNDTKTSLKLLMKDFKNIPADSWEHTAQERPKWHYLIDKGAVS